MLARVTRVLFIAWFAALAALLLQGRRHGWPFGVWVGLYLLVLGHPTVLGLELLLARSVALRSGAPRARWRDLLRAWLGERTAKFWLPERWSFVSEVPKTSVGKFDKKVLRARNTAGELDVEQLA